MGNKTHSPHPGEVLSYNIGLLTLASTRKEFRIEFGIPNEIIRKQLGNLDFAIF
jgi:hypothetical protein